MWFLGFEINAGTYNPLWIITTIQSSSLAVDAIVHDNSYAEVDGLNCSLVALKSPSQG